MTSGESANTLDRDARIDALVASLDGEIAAQLDAILHHPSFVRFETTWRGVWEFVSRLRPEHGVIVELLNVSREDLICDFDDAPDVRRSGLYKLAHQAVCDNWGAHPYAALLGLYEVGDDAESMRLTRFCGEVAKATNAPFIVGCAPALVRRLVKPEASDQAARRAWLSLRHEPSARLIAAVATRWLVRDAHTLRTDELAYRETWASEDLRPWASGALLVARLLAESFAETRLAVRLTSQILDGLPGAPSATAELSPALGRDEVAALAAEGVLAFEPASMPGAVVCREAPTLLHPEVELRAGLSADDRALNGTLPAALFVGRMLTHLRVVRASSFGLGLDAAELQSTLREAIELLPQCGLPSERLPTAERPASRFLRRSRRMLRSHRLDVEKVGHELELRLSFQPNWGLGGRFATFVGEARVYDERSTTTRSSGDQQDYWNSRTDPPMTRAEELSWRIRVIQSIGTPPDYAIEMLGRFAELAPHVREHMGVSDEMFERGMLGLGEYGMPVAFHHLPLAERDRLARTNHAAFQATRAFERDLDDATADHLIDCGAEEAQRRVIRRKPTRARLERASHSAWPKVRADVADRTDDPALLSRLARDPEQAVRLAVARRSDAPDDALALLLFDDEVLVRRSAAWHLGPRPGAGPVLARAASDPDERVRAAVARFAVSEEASLRLLDDELPAIRRAAAREGALSSATLHALVHDADEGVRFALAERNDAWPELLDELARDPSVDVREAVADHRVTSTGTLLSLAADAAPSVREVVALRPELDEGVLELLRSSPDEVVAARLRER